MARVVVFAPSPLLTITIEERGGRDDIHLHAGGQGVWVARMLGCLDIDTVVCAAFGGETGDVLESLAERERFTVRAVAADAENPAYVHDRRSGKRDVVADMSGAPLARHELDELYGVILAEGLEADAVVLTGPADVDAVPAEVYERLAADLGANGVPVIADLSKGPLAAVLRGGVRLLKVSHEELENEDRSTGDDEDLTAALSRLRAEGAQDVVISRADQPALVLAGDTVSEVHIPQLHPVDHRGAGDSMTAGMTAAIAEGLPVEDAVRLGAAAGALNVTRRGLGTGNRQEIEQLAGRIELRPLGRSHAVRQASPDELAERARPA